MNRGQAAPSRAVIYHKLPFPDVSWAGEGNDNHSYCFGTENGSIRLMEGFGPPGGMSLPKRVIYPFVDSMEAINGIAFHGDLMGVSTRGEVIVSSKIREGTQPEFWFRLDQGAHDVLASPAGGFIAPVGPAGLLHIHPNLRDRKAKYGFASIDRSFNFYRIAHLGLNSNGDDVLLCAGRGDGLLSWHLPGGGSDGVLKLFESSNLDFVGVCSLRSARFPFAAVAVTRDGSIFISEDFSGNSTAISLRGIITVGIVYRVLSTLGHIIVLTSDSLYVVWDMVPWFEAEDRHFRPIRFRRIPMEAIDAFLAFGRLLIVMMDCVAVVDIASFVDEVPDGGAPEVSNIPADIESSVNRGIGLLQGPVLNWTPGIDNLQPLQLSISSPLATARLTP